MNNTLEHQLAKLYSSEASREHLLKDGMRLLNAAQVAYIFNFSDYRNAYRLEIERGRRGWLAKHVKRHLEREPAKPTTAAKSSRSRQGGRVSEAAPWWGGPGAA